MNKNLIVWIFAALFLIAGALAADLEIYRLQPNPVENDHNMKIGVILYNPNPYHITISNINDRWSIDKVVDSAKLISCIPSCTVDDTQEKVIWIGNYTITAKNYSTFDYIMDINGVTTGTYANVTSSNSNTSKNFSNILIQDHVATSYLTISTDGTNFYEAVGPLNISANQTFTAKIEEVGVIRNIQPTQYVIMQLPANWTNIGTSDSHVSVSGNKIIYDIQSTIEGGYETFTFYTKTPSITGVWNFNGTLNGTDEGLATHNDLFELIVTTLERTPPSLPSIITANTEAKSIYWNWTNVTDTDFYDYILYLDNTEITTTQDNYYNATALFPGTNHTLLIYTRDVNGNINNTGISNTAITKTAQGSPISSLNFFIASEAGRASAAGTEGNEIGDESPISLNDYGETTQKCENWQCTEQSAGGAVDKDMTCRGGWDCTIWNGVSCQQWECNNWALGTTSRRQNFCSGDWQCTSWNNNSCDIWNCSQWSASPTNDYDYNCLGQWSCNNWNGYNCGDWSCTDWGIIAVDDDDGYCAGIWDCTDWNSSSCSSWNCTSWQQPVDDQFDVYCSGSWNCSSWNGNYCDNWQCTTKTITGNNDRDHYCSNWNCSIWDTQKKVCGTWTCGQWNEGATVDIDYYCSGSWNCTSWQILSYDYQPPAKITNLTSSKIGITWIYWNWTTPTDSDFNKSIIYLNGANIANTSNNYYNATGLNEYSIYTITINTIDHRGNINNTNVSNTTRTSDATAPNWNPLPSNQTTEYGSAFSYDISATDLQTITYSINDTIRFAVNPASGLITNNTFLQIGNYYLQVAAIDISGNTNSTIILITVLDTKKPAWNPSPSDQITECGYAFSYDVNATDLQTITYSINDTTRFAINSATGEITNNTNNMVGVYGLKINATDASGNVNLTSITITVQDTTPPAWNPIPLDQDVEYSHTLDYYINATDHYTITYYVDDTTNFDIGSSTGELINILPLTIKTYPLNISVQDSNGNVNSVAIYIHVQDTIPPSWTVLPSNRTAEYGSSFNYDIGATDLQSITYSVDDTTNFYINPSTGLINNNTFLAVGTYPLQISAIDTSNNVNSTTIYVKVQDTTPPHWPFSPPDHLQIYYGTAVDITPTALDLSGISQYWIDDNINFIVNTTTGNVKNNTVLAVGPYAVNMSVNDTYGNTKSLIATIEVVDISTPIFYPTPTNQIIGYGYAFAYDVSATDDIGIGAYSINDTLNFKIDPSTGLIENNTALYIGQYSLDITVNDTAGNTNSETITITVSDMDTPHWLIVPSDQIGELGNPFSYQLNATDNIAISSYSIDNINFQINPSTGLITNKTHLSVGNYSLQVSVNDTSGNENSSGIIIIIIIDTTSPEWNPLPPVNVLKEYGEPYYYDSNATDLQTISYSIDNTTLFKVNSFTGLITNKITLPVGNHILHLNATDASGNWNSTTILITVQDTTPPVWQPSPSNQTAEYAFEFNYDTNAYDLQTITYSIDDTTNFAINASTGLIKNNTLMDTGEYALTINATDASGNTNSTTIIISVQDTTPPQWNPTPADILLEYGQSFAYDANAIDFESVYYLVNDTLNFAINTGSGLITNNTKMSLRNYSLRIIATDANLNSNSANITIFVQDTTSPNWVQTPVNQLIKKDSNFTYDINATDLQPITYSIDDTTNFTINSTTGIITNNTNLGLGSYNLQITVSDPSGNINSTSIIIEVQDPNVPVINLTAPSNGESLAAGTTFYILQIITDETAVCRYSTQNTTWGNMAQLSATNSISHTQIILGLSNGNTYHYYILCEDNETIPNRMNTPYNLQFSIATLSTPSEPPSAGGNSGGGGGGGGGRTVCVEKWNCTEWGLCINKIRKRSCTDEKNCNTTTKKPEEIEACEQVKKKAESEAEATVEDISDVEKISTDINGEPVSFYYNSELYSIDVLHIKDDTAEFIIQPTDKIIELETLETENIDLDRDGVSDVELTLKSIDEGIPRVIMKHLEIQQIQERSSKITGKAISVKPDVNTTPMYTLPIILLIISALILFWIRKSDLNNRIKNVLTATHVTVSAALIMSSATQKAQENMTGFFVKDITSLPHPFVWYIRILLIIIISLILSVIFAMNYKHAIKPVLSRLADRHIGKGEIKNIALTRKIKPLSEINKEIIKHMAEIKNENDDKKSGGI